MSNSLAIAAAEQGQEEEEAEEQAEDVLLVNGEEVKVNKHLLASNSHYFNCFFFAKEYRQNKTIVVEPPANAEHFKRMMDALDPINRPLDDQCIEGVLILADQFFVDNVKQKCRLFLTDQSKHSSFFKYRLADKYGLANLKQQILHSPKETFFEYVDFGENLREYAKLDEPARKTLDICLENQKMMVEKVENEEIAEYGRMIGLPNVFDLKDFYNKEKLLNLIQNGNDITKSIYIQNSKWLTDRSLLQSIVDLMVNTRKPEKMIGEVKIEFAAYEYFFHWPQNAKLKLEEKNWPQNEELKLKEKKSNVTIKINEAAMYYTPETISRIYLAEYELVNRACRFHVDIYYCWPGHFNKNVVKFVYRRLEPDLALVMDAVDPVNRPLDDQCIEGVLHQADQFFAPEVKQRCSKFLAKVSNRSGVFKYRLADKYGLANLKQQILLSPKETFFKYVDFGENLREYAKLDEPAREALDICLENQKKMIEYAALIGGVPNVASLRGNYKREKMLHLIHHGNGITKSLHLQYNQKLDDEELLQAIVDLMISTEKPEEMVGEVKIEAGNRNNLFTWPQNKQLILKKKTNDGYSAVYELANQGCRFQVFIYYSDEFYFGKYVSKFAYHRLA